MKSKKSTAIKKTSNVKKNSASSENYSQEKNTDLKPENVYIHDVLDGMNKVVDFYTQTFGNFLELGSKFAIANKKLQQKCLEYGDDATACNSSATKQLSSCKSLPEAVHTHSDFVQNHMNNNMKHLTKLSEFSSELTNKFVKDVFNNMDDINAKIKESCHLNRTKS